VARRFPQGPAFVVNNLQAELPTEERSKSRLLQWIGKEPGVYECPITPLDGDFQAERACCRLEMKIPAPFGGREEVFGATRQREKRLENELRPELQNARVVGLRDLQELATAETSR
jgi:hypothetical protein